MYIKYICMYVYIYIYIYIYYTYITCIIYVYLIYNINIIYLYAHWGSISKKVTNKTIQNKSHHLSYPILLFHSYCSASKKD